MRRNRRLQVILLLLGSLGGALVWFSACNSNDGPSTTTSINAASKPRVNSAPPNTSLPMPPVNGGSLNNLGWTFEGNKRNIFSDFRGKVLILDFYATWCEPCRRSVPHLIELQKKYQDQGLNVVGLNVGGPDDEQEVPAFAKEFGIQYTLAIPDDDLVNLLMAQIDAIPQTFVFDRQGLLAERLIGYGPNAGDRIDRAVEAALKTPAP
jgi:thiol-disulfide isomerase/thioredoxin